MRLVGRGHSDVGRVREGNEDGYLDDDRIGLFAVADGMGGHRGGEVASATALEALRAAISGGRPIRDAIESANRAVFDKAADDTALRGMGTTITAVQLAAGGTLLVGHVGDSRAYLLHDGELRQLTADHSLVEELVREGRLSPEQAAVHPRRSIITRALGIEDDVEVDVYPIELHAGDRLLLCSDGLTTMVNPDEIAAVLRREDDPDRASRRLVDAANAAGGEDNITAVVVDAAEDRDVAPALPVEVDEDAPAPQHTAVTPAADLAEAPPPRRRTRRAARSTLRVAAWALPILLILGVAVGATAWYARNTYFVTFDAEGNVAIFQGRPGGVLGWNPTLEQTTDIARDDVTEKQRLDLTEQQQYSSLQRARDYVAGIERDLDDRAKPSTGSSTTTSPIPTLPST